MLPCLQKLCLVKVKLDEQTIQSLISNCKSMEDLRLIRCSGLNELKICNHIKLNRIEVYQCHGIRKVELGCSNLDTILFRGNDFRPCKISLGSCKFLKNLTLGCVQPLTGEKGCILHEFIEKLTTTVLSVKREKKSLEKRPIQTNVWMPDSRVRY